MKIGSLFSGYGGLDLAVTAVTGAEVAWHCEWEDAPSKILDRNFPGVPKYRDVEESAWIAYKKSYGTLCDPLRPFYPRRRL